MGGRIGLFEPFCQNPNSGSIPVEEFDSVALAVEENEYFSRERVFAQFVAHDDAEGVEAFPQVAGAGGQADFNAVGQDHGWARRDGWMRRMNPPPSSSSTSGPTGADRWCADSSWNSRNAGGCSRAGRFALVRPRQFMSV